MKFEKLLSFMDRNKNNMHCSLKTKTSSKSKVRTFWEAHKNLHNPPHASKRPNHEEDFFKFCVLLRKSELYVVSENLLCLMLLAKKVKKKKFLDCIYFMVKYRYSEKASKIWKKTPTFLENYLVYVKQGGKFFQFFCSLLRISDL